MQLKRTLPLVLVTLVACVTAPALIGGPAVAQADGIADAETSGIPIEEQTLVGVFDVSDGSTANETRPPHRNPDDFERDGDAELIADWLAGYLGGSLEGSTVELSQSEYELARDFLGDDYDHRLGQLIEVAGDTGRESDEQAAETFEEIRDVQEEYVDAVEAYERTREAYEEAVAEGDEERARELARELDNLSAEVEARADVLASNYEYIEELTGVDLEAARERILAIDREIQEAQTSIREAQFVETRLSLDAESGAISFLDPLVAMGRVETVEGDPIANRTIALEVGSQTVTTTTDASGEFEFVYRPQLLPLSTERLEITYRPEATSSYLPAESTLDVSVEQVEPEIEFDDWTSDLRYDETVSVEGTITVDGIAVEDVPARLAISGTTLEAARTDGDGRFVLEEPLPADVPPGEHDLSVRLPLTDRALAGVDQETTVTVQETETFLSVDAGDAGDGAIAIEGELRTVDGVAVSNRPITLSIEGEPVDTVETDRNGRYAATIEVPLEIFENEDAMADDEVTISVQVGYEEPGTNLAGSSAERTVAIGPPVTATGPSTEAATEKLPWWAWSAVVAISIGTVVGLYRFRRSIQARIASLSGVSTLSALIALFSLSALTSLFASVFGGGGDRSDHSAADAAGGAATHSRNAPVADRTVETVDPITVARNRLAGGDPDGAIEAAYLGAREELQSVIAANGSLTHWEFHGACREAGLNGGRFERLTTVTEAYEYARFAPTPASPDRANDTIEATEGLLS